MVTLPTLLLQIIPFTLLGLLATWLGAWLWPTPDSTAGLILRILLLAFSFLGLLALKHRSGWNVALFVLFSLNLGPFWVSFQAPETPAGVGTSWGITLCILAFGWTISSNQRRLWSEVGVAFWFLGWMYLIGWVILALLKLDLFFLKVWAGFGLCLFAGISIGWFSNLKKESQSLPGSTRGIDLYLISLNMLIASGFLLSSG